MMEVNERWLWAQQSVLGACLLDDGCAGYVWSELTEDDFSDSLRTIYRAIRELYLSGRAVDPVSVLSALGDDKYREPLRQLMEIVPTTRNIKEYVQIVAEQSRIAKLQALGMQLATIDNLTDAQALLDKANGSMIAKSGIETYTLKELLLDFFKRYEKPADYYPWFIPDLRKIVRLAQGNYMVLAARPSVGKSAFAAQAAAYWAIVAGKRVGFYSHEMGKDEITDRLLAMAGEVRMNEIQDRTLSEKDKRRIMQVATKIRNAPLFVMPAADHGVEDMKNHALKHHLDVLIVDYLQIVPGVGDNEYARVTGVTSALQRLCKSTGITVISLSQLDRTRGAKPSLEDLRSSGQIEQDADIVAFLHRTDDNPSPVELIIRKNRNGVTATTLLEFAGSSQQFLYKGRGDQAIKAYDYSKHRTVQEPSDFEPLPDQLYVPFEN